MASDSATLLRQAVRSGFQKEGTRGGHVRLIAPDGERIVCASTPSDHRTVANDRALLKRHGLGQRDDKSRRSRMAREASSGVGISARVLGAMQERPNQQVRVRELREQLGLEAPQLSNALQYLARTVPGLVNLTKGIWVYTPDGDTLQPTQPAAPGEGAAGTAAAGTGGGKAVHPGPDGCPGLNGHSGGPAHLNGHTPSRSGPSALLDGADERLVAVPAEPPAPVKVIPSALPDDVPGMFEAVTVHRSGALVLRDENGELWLAHALKIGTPTVSLG